MTLYISAIKTMKPNFSHWNRRKYDITSNNPTFYQSKISTIARGMSLRFCKVDHQSGDDGLCESDGRAQLYSKTNSDNHE